MFGSGATYFCLALGQHLVGHLQRDRGVGDINVDDIALFDQADGAAGSGFRADVADGSTTACTGEAAVGDQGHGLVQLHTGQSGGGVQHLTHAGAALGAFVADDHHIARDDLARVDGGNGRLLAVEYTGRAGMLLHLRRPRRCA